MYKEIFEKLKFAYLLNDEDIIKKLGISPNQYKKMLQTKEIPHDLLIKIKDVFNLSFDYLITGIPTKEDEKILNRSLDEKEWDKLMYPAFREIKEKIIRNGFEKYWQKINPKMKVFNNSLGYEVNEWYHSKIMDTSAFRETHGHKPITFLPWQIFDLSDLNFWDFCKANFQVTQNPPIHGTFWKDFCKANFQVAQNKEKDLITWDDYEKYFIKQGKAIYITKSNENQTENRKNDSCTMDPKWIDRCLTTLKGEKLEEKNLKVYNFELTKLTSYSDASKWDFELIDKLLKIGAIYLKKSEIRTRGYDGGSYTSINEFEPDYVMTEFIKSLVEKNLKK